MSITNEDPDDLVLTREDGLTELVSRRDAFVAFLVATGDNGHEAEDIVDKAIDAIERRSLDTTRPIRNYIAYMHKVLMSLRSNVARSESRRQTRERKASEGNPETDLFSEIDSLEAITRLLGPLPRRQREAMYLRYVDDLPRAEVARRMLINERTVQAHIRTAKRSIRDLGREEALRRLQGDET